MQCCPKATMATHCCRHIRSTDPLPRRCAACDAGSRRLAACAAAAARCSRGPEHPAGTCASRRARSSPAASAGCRGDPLLHNTVHPIACSLPTDTLMLCAGHRVPSRVGHCINVLAHTVVLISADLQGPRRGGGRPPHLARRLPEGASAPGPTSAVQKPEAHVQSGRAEGGAAHEAHQKVLGAGILHIVSCSPCVCS